MKYVKSLGLVILLGNSAFSMAPKVIQELGGNVPRVAKQAGGLMRQNPVERSLAKVTARAAEMRKTDTYLSDMHSMENSIKNALASFKGFGALDDDKEIMAYDRASFKKMLRHHVMRGDFNAFFRKIAYVYAKIGQGDLTINDLEEIINDAIIYKDNLLKQYDKYQGRFGMGYGELNSILLGYLTMFQGQELSQELLLFIPLYFGVNRMFSAFKHYTHNIQRSIEILNQIVSDFKYLEAKGFDFGSLEASSERRLESADKELAALIDYPRQQKSVESNVVDLD